MLRRIMILLVLVVGGVTAFFVFYHPPMRLMPAPLLFQKGGAQIVDLAPALQDGSEIDVFYATSRLPVGPRDDRLYSVIPDHRLHLGRAYLTIGDKATTVEQVLEWTFASDQGDRPFIRLDRMNEAVTLSQGDDPEAADAWLAEVAVALQASRDKDVLVYIHGANTTVERAAGQAAMLRHFTGRHSVVVLFAWPTAENFLRYRRDVTSALSAAPKLSELIAMLVEHTPAEHVNVFTYSAGAMVGSTGLANLARTRPEAASHVQEVYHAAPDADFRDFVDDMAVYSGLVGRTTTAVNLGDSALRLAAAVNRASRAGRPNLEELEPEAAEWLLDSTASQKAEVVQVNVDAMPDLPATSHTFWYDDPWVSNDAILTLLFNLAPAARGLEEGKSVSGTSYWTFTKDYPERMTEVVDLVRGAAN
ncbi:alpha/beta hydrolase [Sedimentitalea sp. JM2-8]|uniref:Alpha/beta hydrolase n=1 Tax=Sedimentitalea xiamensis TaxID=3050037 RepID=A0ABT7FA75_9RHOB|nr:alpha/beta hydrolase [Sedimentitalea xiamensis]MDK3072004.1 alpha/beta hydrolase [Sedimentitalea xiamensis]